MSRSFNIFLKTLCRQYTEVTISNMSLHHTEIFLLNGFLTDLYLFSDLSFRHGYNKSSWLMPFTEMHFLISVKFNRLITKFICRSRLPWNWQWAAELKISNLWLIHWLITSWDWPTVQREIPPFYKEQEVLRSISQMFEHQQTKVLFSCILTEVFVTHDLLLN